MRRGEEAEGCGREMVEKTEEGKRCQVERQFYRSDCVSSVFCDDDDSHK